MKSALRAPVAAESSLSARANCSAGRRCSNMSPLTATARTIVDTTAVQINAGQVLTLCEHNPRFGYEFMRRAAVALAKRLSATRLQLLDVYGTEMPPVAESQEEES